MNSLPVFKWLDPARFQGTVDSQPVALYTLRNAHGMVVGITNYGARIEQVVVPDRHGRFDDVVLGYGSLQGVLDGAPSMGAFVGRYAGRIGQARFTLAGTEYLLGANNGAHCLHGGHKGTRFQVFEARQRHDASVEMSYVFADGEEGFPGTLALRLVYSLTEANELVLDYEATALDKSTVASFTTHAFFNLEGESAGDISQHEVMIPADRYFGMDAELVASGDILPLDGGLMDFRQPVMLGQRMRQAGSFAMAGEAQDEARIDGYDDCYLIRRPESEKLPLELALCARVSAVRSGRVMEVWSTEPALQFFTGKKPQDPLPGGVGKGGQPYFQQQGFCLEPQGYPNAPNHAHFPPAVYQPGQVYRGKTVYRFGTLPGR